MAVNRIVHTDAVSGLKKLPNGIIDLVVTSPPYDDLRTYDDEMDFNHIVFENIADELYKKVSDGGVVVWVVGDSTVKGSETGSSFRQALYFRDIGFKLHDTMIYRKNSSSFPARANGNRYTQLFEYMFVFTKGAPRVANLICDKENRWEGYKGFGKQSQRETDGELKKFDRKPTPKFSPRYNIWYYATGKGYTTKDYAAVPELKNHPAMFPEQLAVDHILTWTEPGDVVADIFVGSGTVPKMAKILGRDYIGFDINESYCEIARKRLEIGTWAKQEQPGVTDKQLKNSKK